MSFLIRCLTKRSVLIITTFVVCYAITASVFHAMPDPVVGDPQPFVSLMYLPHGVSILAIMLFGWKALPALLAGNMIGDVLFKPDMFQTSDAIMWVGPMCIAILSSYLAFEVFRCIGKNSYAREGIEISWKQILAVGCAAAAINALAQKIVFSDILAAGHDQIVYWSYAIGNVWGLFVFLCILMFGFRWARLYRRANTGLFD